MCSRNREWTGLSCSVCVLDKPHRYPSLPIVAPSWKQSAATVTVSCSCGHTVQAVGSRHSFTPAACACLGICALLAHGITEEPQQTMTVTTGHVPMFHFHCFMFHGIPWAMRCMSRYMLSPCHHVRTPVTSCKTCHVLIWSAIASVASSAQESGAQELRNLFLTADIRH